MEIDLDYIKQINITRWNGTRNVLGQMLRQGLVSGRSGAKLGLSRLGGRSEVVYGGS